MSVAIAAMAGFALAAVVVGEYWLGRRHELRMVRRWAAENQYEVVRLRQRGFFERAPFSIWTTHRTPNYFVVVRDRDGKQCSGWLRLGTVFERTGRNKVEVRWEQQP